MSLVTQTQSTKMFGESAAGWFSMPSLMNPQKGNFRDALKLDYWESKNKSKGDIFYQEHSHPRVEWR